MAPNGNLTASPLTTDSKSTLPPPYERKGTFKFLELPREIRDMIYAEVADPTYTLDTPLAKTVSYMRTKSSLENYQKHTPNSTDSNSSNSTNENPLYDTLIDDPTTRNNNNPYSQTNLDDPSHPALSLNNLRLHPLAQTNLQIRHEYLSAHFATPTFTLPIFVCALQAPHPRPRTCNTPLHSYPITRQYATRHARRHAEFLDSGSPALNGERPVLRHQHFKVTIFTDYNDATTQPLHTLHMQGTLDRNTVRVQWEGFVDVFFHRGALSVEGVLVGPAGTPAVGETTTMTTATTEGMAAAAKRAEKAFERLKADLERSCAGGRSRATHTTSPCEDVKGWDDDDDDDDTTSCPHDSMAAVLSELYGIRIRKRG